jgi:manganese/zinc/iron transport system permease protein
MEGACRSGRDRMDGFLAALTLQAGYNAALVSVGAALTGLSAGAAGVFLVLRKRALVSDAMAHATLPGVTLAFLAMVALGGDGRALPGLVLGAAVTSLMGLLAVDWLTRATRLSEDAAIGAVLSSFFGAGVVLLTVIQTLGAGRQAGLEGFLLGQTAGMLWSDAVTILAGGIGVALVLVLARRPMTLVAFDPVHAAVLGVQVRSVDLLILALALAITVTGLRIVGLVMIVALLVIPPAAARFWTDRVGGMIWIAGGIGALAGWIGTALSAAAPDLPAGPLIVLTAASLFVLSIVVAPTRGVLARISAARGLQTAVHRRQGLLALARGETVLDRFTLRLLRRQGLIRGDGLPTDAGRAAAAAARRDEARWVAAQALYPADGRLRAGLGDLAAVLTPDELAKVNQHMAPGAA